MTEVDRDLVEQARSAASRARADYSGFAVGAAALASDGRVFIGANIELSVYGLSMCAERVAVFKAYTEGADDIVALAVAGSTVRPISPCGACRQVIWELAPNARILLANQDGSEVAKHTPADLLPNGFFLNTDRIQD
ncbi:MAG: cytidine deaminase [Kyrpidia tusciae]|nr:cytidine deaminase [Kyrpidia tusciae]MBE3552946.1 cytidine deaminase [Kyrpidia tusciae]